MLRLWHEGRGKSLVLQAIGDQMPVHRNKDGKGPYYQWGESGKKYHNEAGNKRNRESAKRKAEDQGKAIRASGYRG